ncbi:MAG: BamA/TamA family outer membrane protein [Reichenbachiella sp.]|uniref:BamA/TamA family outer membrane protein n=1 Tax=Reichenbachiella sp. TaxID=2184521 RepID=UPI003267DAF7
MYRVFGKYLSLLGLALIINLNAWSQLDTTVFNVRFIGMEQNYIPRQNSYDSSSFKLACKVVLKELRNDGYWLASIDSLTQQEDILVVHFFQGRKFDHVRIEIIDDQGVFNQSRTLNKASLQKVPSISLIESSVENVLDQLEESGYPFASLSIDSSHVENENLNIQLRLDAGARITYDSIAVKPEGLIKPVFLSKYLKMEYGADYDERDLSRVEEKIKHLPFLDLQKIYTTFQLKKAKVHLELEPRKVNHFNGLLGLVPGADGEGVEVTGELDLSISNLFQSGKKIEINWTKLQPGSQQLHASYLHPILLGSPLDFYFAIDQIRQDTIYSNRSLQLAFDYRPTKNLELRMSYEGLIGNALNDQQDLSGDFDINYYGLAVTWYNLDRLISPKRGVKLRSEISVGRKSIIGAVSIPESTQYRMQSAMEWYKPVKSRSVIYMAAKGGALLNDFLYLNDLFRLGGLNTIRGFNELDFFASRYLLFNMEWRYYLDPNSYMVAFYDQSFMEYSIVNGSFDDAPAGLGVGMEFANDQGVFKILYGLGKRDGDPFSFATSKIHFGYTAIF